jgi:hypothetical protein
VANTAEDYATWIVANEDKKGSEQFNTVAAAYEQAKTAEQPVAEPSEELLPPTGDYPNVDTLEQPSFGEQAIDFGKELVAPLVRAAPAVAAVGSGTVAGLAHLANTPYQASELAAEVVSGRQLDGFGDANANAVESAKRASIEGAPAGAEHLQTGAEFGSGGAVIRATQKASRYATEFFTGLDFGTGIAVQAVRDNDLGVTAELATTVIPAIALGRFAPKPIDSIQGANAIDQELAGLIGKVKGSGEEILTNIARAEKEGIAITLDMAAPSNPLLGGIFDRMLGHNTFGSSWLNFKNSVSENLGNLSARVKMGEDFSDSTKLFNEAKGSFEDTVKVVDNIETSIIQNGAATTEDASKVAAEILERVKDSSRRVGDSLYEQADIANLGNTSAEGTKALRALADDILPTSLGAKGSAMVKGSSLEKLEGVLAEALGDTVRVVKKTARASKVKSLQRDAGSVEVKVKGTKAPSIESIKEIRTLVLKEAKVIETSRAGKDTRSRALNNVANLLTEELNKFPQLKDANDWWKASEGFINYRAIAKVFKDSGNPDTVLPSLLSGKDAAKNVREVAKHIKELDPKDVKSFTDAVRHIFDTELATSLDTKGGMSVVKWQAWLTKRGGVLSELDKSFKTNMSEQYSHFANARKAVESKALSFKAIEEAEFAQLRKGMDINTAVNSAVEKGTLANLVAEMPTKSLKVAVTKRAVSNTLSLRNESLSNSRSVAERLRTQIGSVYKYLGKEKGKEVLEAANQLQRLGVRFQEGKIGSLPQDVSITPSQAKVDDKVIKTMTAVIGNVYRKAFVTGRILNSYEKQKVAEGFMEDLMFNKDAMKRLVALSKQDPKAFKAVWYAGAPAYSAVTAGDSLATQQGEQ